LGAVGRHHGLRWGFAVGLLVLVLVLPEGVLASPTGPPGAAPGVRAPPVGALAHPPAPGAPTRVTLTVNSSYSTLSPEFFGVTINNEVRLLRGETDWLNATPARTLVWPGAMAGEDYDPLNNVHWDTYSGTPKTALTSEAQFVQLCKATRCNAVVQVPAEIDQPTYAEKIVNYTERTLNFTPAYWMIGNEPELWGHWKVPWNNWSWDYTGGPTPTQFGQEVVQYVNAIRKVDNTTPILGLPASGCNCSAWTFYQWIGQVLNVTGTKVQSVAFHEYPAGWLGTGDGSLTDFYRTLHSYAGIPWRVPNARKAVATSTCNCNASVWISELGAALSYSAYGGYADTFAGVLSIGSQLVQSADLNVTNVDLFAAELGTTNSWFTPGGTMRPDYTLYGSILTHLGDRAYSVNVSNTSGVGSSVYALDTVQPTDHGRQDLVVYNDDITHAIQFSPKFAGGYDGARVEVYYWNGSIHTSSGNGTTWVEPYTPEPIPIAYPGGLPANFTLPPQSLALFESYPGNGTYVRLTPSGIPAGIPWYASVNGQEYRTTANNVTLFLAPGDYPVGSSPIDLPIGGTERNPAERLAPFPPSPLAVSGTYTNATIGFVPQWRVNVTASPAGGGNVTPMVGWWNASEPLNLSVVGPASGYAFDRWSGWGPGSYNGTGRHITIIPTGRVTEKALFVPGNTIVIQESGLPTGTSWSVTLHGFTWNSTTNDILVYEPNGSYGFTVNPVPGYRSLPKDGGFSVHQSLVEVVVTFVRLTPAPPVFAVDFAVSGLPSGLGPVPITVRNVTEMPGAPFRLINGSYAYRVGYVPGFHTPVTNRTFVVSGGPLTVTVPFVPTTYTARWEANGTRQNLTWSLVLNGTPIPATSAWISQVLPNGTYPYTVELPANFSASPRSGVMVVQGASAWLQLNFSLLRYAAEVLTSGLSSALPWAIRLGNRTEQTEAADSSFLAPNGTYTFDVHPPSGYYAVPSHGNFTVAGVPAPLRIVFHLTSNKPTAALVAQLSMGAIAVSLWIGVSVVGGFAVVRWIRRRAG
jgi:hypothetical protein